MKGQTHGGKGSAQRPVADKQKFADNWDKIFNKEKQNDTTDSTSNVQVQKPKDR